MWRVIHQEELLNGAGGRTRTDMSLTSPDFESGAYTNFATPACGKDNTVSFSLAQLAMGLMFQAAKLTSYGT